ncbi:MAG TPA: EFR1 family ferrodoxin [Prolixibacteraceae bacterium]|nr:EFR1 family ferrodoxin [Prolixibacteraceae bacterium]
MKNSEIYYFSGTGNSLYVAREIARLTHSELIAIPGVIDHEKIQSESENLCLVFPVYLAQLNGIPLMVKRFVEKIDAIQTKKLFAVCTCGGLEYFNALPTLKNLERHVRTIGGHLCAGYSVRLPMNNLNYPPYVPHKHPEMFAKAEKKISDISVRMLAGKKDKSYIGENILNLLMTPLYRWMKNLYIADLKKKAKVDDTRTLNYEELIALTDRSIEINERCTGCGICVNVCPAGNIELNSNKPVWLHHCEMCMACDEWCPEKAIEHWNKKPGNDYHYPGIKRSDMILKTCK